MTPEEALQIADKVGSAHTGKPLTDLQRMILRESLADKGYEEMEGYETQHIKNEGSKLWNLLSAALGEKVSKTSFRGALEKRLKSANITPKPPVPSLYNSQTWVGRELLIDDLLSKLHGETRLVWLTGVSGIGKTTLAECLAARAWDANKPFQSIRVEILDGQSPDFATGAANLLTKMGDKDLDPQERNDPKRLGDRLLQKLQSNRYWIQLDALERLLNSDQPTEFADSYWLTFFQLCLTSIEFQSRLVLTSQALPKKMAVLKDRKFWHWAELKGLLSSAECLDLFAKHGISANEENTLTLSKIGQAYEGHPLVLQVIAGEICQDFDGNVTQYWERYGDEFEQVARKLEAKRVDSFLYNQELKERVRERVEESLKQLSSDGLDLLCRSAVYRRPVPQTFWQAMLWEHTPKQQQDAYSLLRNRTLIEKEGTIKRQDIIRQHNLIRDIAYDLLRQDSFTWETAERKATEMWLSAYEPASNAPNLEKVRGYLEAFHHYCEVGDWIEAAKIISTPLSSSNEEVHNQLQIWGYYREQIWLYNKLLGKLPPFIEFLFLGNLGLAYFYLSNYSQAIECHRQYFTIASKIQNPHGEGIALLHLGNIYSCLGSHPQAIECYEQTLTIAREISDKQLEGNALGGLGLACRSLGNYCQAIKHHRRHLRIANKMQDEEGKGVALDSLGLVYARLGKYLRALDYHEQHLYIAREIGNRIGEGNVLGNIGNVYLAMGDYDQAIEYQHQHLIIAREIGDRKGEGAALCNLGTALIKCKKYPDALKPLEAALEIFKKINAHQDKSYALANLAKLYQKLGQIDRALEYCEQALAISTELGIPLAEECRKLKEELEKGGG